MNLKLANYNAPARAAYNTFLRSMLYLTALSAMYDVGPPAFNKGVRTIFNLPYEKDIFLGANSLDLFEVWVALAFKQSPRARNNSINDMNHWLNAVRGFYIG